MEIEEAIVVYRGDPDPPLAKALTRCLNTLIHKKSIWEEKGVDRIELRDETVRLHSENPQGENLEKLNRKLLEDAYPGVGSLALASAGRFNLLPSGSISIRIHSIGGWGAITMGKNLAMTAFELFGLHIKANPKYGSEKKGQPTTFYATLSREPVRLNGELAHVDVVLSPDPNVFRHSNPLAGLADGGVFVLQSDQSPESSWAHLPSWARREITGRAIRFFTLDAFQIAAA